MTTATPRDRTTPVGSAVRRALVVTGLVGAVTMVVAAVVAGSAGLLGALVGLVMVAAFFSAGTVVLQLVTRLAPATSLLIALLTYTLKVVLIGLVFLGLSRSGALEESIDPQWLGGAVIVCTLTWLGTQIVFSVRARQPLYDLPSQPEEPSVR
jgi:ATP synthase protein I